MSFLSDLKMQDETLEKKKKKKLIMQCFLGLSIEVYEGKTAHVLMPHV